MIGVVSRNAWGKKKEVDEAVYGVNFGAGKLEPLSTIHLVPNSVYFLGASSSPDQILVTKIDNKYITYRKYPYEQDLRIDAQIGSDLIAKGTSTWLSKGYGKYRPALKKTLELNLAGKKGPENGKHKPKDYERIRVGITVNHSDPYGYAQQFGVIVGMFDEASGYVEIETNRRTLRDEIKKDRNITNVKEL